MRLDMGEGRRIHGPTSQPCPNSALCPGGGGVIRARSSKNACLWERACGGYNMEIPISLRLAVFKFYYSYLSDVF